VCGENVAMENRKTADRWSTFSMEKSAKPYQIQINCQVIAETWSNQLGLE
jgi:hypothetical protein